MACVSTCLIVSPRLTQSNFSSTKPLIRLRSSVNCYSFAGILKKRLPSIRRKFASHGISVVAASLDKVSGAIRPGGLVESDKLPTDVRKRAMEAVDECGRRVTVGDVSSRAGLKVTEAQKALQALAADTDGFLEVSDEGDVLYVFPRDYRSKLATKSLRIQIEPFLEKAKGAVDYLTRVSFGTALIASIVIVYTTIIVLLSSKSEDDNRQRRRGRGFDSGFNFYIYPIDLFWYWDPDYYRRRRAREDEGQGMNFIESVFFFVFGDGDPNQGIEEERWQMIGRYITSRGGVVAADELAPYLDVPSFSFLGFPFDVYRTMNHTFYLFFFGLMVNLSWMKREIFCIAFRPCNVRLLDLVDERNMWGNGLTGLQIWRSFSRRKNGNLVKLVQPREQWSLA